MKSDQALLQVKSLSHKFNNQEVLNIESLNFKSGKVYGIIGPSGAGKSTLLRILNLLTPPTQGKVFFHDHDIYRLQPQQRIEVQRKMAMVFQKPVLFKDTVKENVAYGLKIRGSDSKEIEDKANEALDRVGLKHLADRSAISLSGGESQRVALARAIVLDIEVLLLDEPTANLDPGNITIIEQLIRRLNQEKRTTVIMVTHNIFQAQRIADDIIFINEGELIEKASAEHIFSAPQDKRTWQFINGEMIY
ncbi:MAG: phosphate ABC transporter ATP-binding protein [Firmicutes bacterium]|nr:phosphate ABC transporter ATP-binding protein [Bacillota bacterium]